MIRSRTARLAVALAASAALIAGCGQGGAESSDSADLSSMDPVQGGTLRWGYVFTAPSLDPAQCGTSAGWQACQAIYGTLMSYDASDGSYTPAMAESVETEDGKVWTLTLREGVTFADGTPYDADAVVFNWERLRDPQSRSTAQRAATEMQWEVVDPRTVKVTLPDVNYKFPTDLQTTFGMIGSPKAITELGADFANNPVGAGPFTLGSWARGTEMTLVRNDGYWDAPRPYLDELVVTVVPDEQQRINAVVSGEVDVNSTQTQSSWESGVAAGLDDNRTPYLTTGTGFRYNFRPEAQTSDPTLRAAITRAIDTQAINNAVHSGAEAPSTLAMPTSFFYEAEPELPTEDLAEAQRLLDEYLAKSGRSEVTVRYVYITGIPMISQEAQILQAQVERLNGVTFELVALDSAARQTALRSGDFDLIYDSVGAWFDPDTLYARYHSSGADNTSGISDPAIDAALDKTRSSEDSAATTAGYVEALRLLTEKDAVVAWMTNEQAYLTRGNVGGLEPTYQYWPRAETLWISE